MHADKRPDRGRWPGAAGALMRTSQAVEGERSQGTAGQSKSAELARFASQLEYAKIPRAVVERIKLCILDAVGCAMFATTLPWSRMLAEYVVDMGGRESAGVWGSGHRVPAANAALVNGTLVHGFELDDLHKKSIVHPSSTAVPAALAVLESSPHASGADLVVALVAGFEVGVRGGMSIGTSHLVKGFHPTGTSGALAAAAAAGRAMRLSPREMEHAISVAASQAAGLMASQHESMVKRMHAGRASQSGVYGAELARRGFVGIDRVFESEYGGYCSTFSDDADLDVLTAGLGQRFETEVVGFKIYSCCGSTQTSVEAVKRMKRRIPFDPDLVTEVSVRTSTATMLHVGWPYEAKSITTAQMNLPYCLAVTLIDGEAFVEQFTEKKIVDPRIVDLAGRVRVAADPEIDAMGPGGRHRVTISVKLRDGSKLTETVDHAKGSDADPVSPSEVEEKFFALVQPVAGKAWAKRCRELLADLERLPSIEGLRELLACPQRP